MRHNVTALRQRLARGSALMAVVKANGYGHGAVPVAQASLAAGAQVLGVATVDEALELRQVGITARLVVLGPLTDAELEAAIAADAEVTLWSSAFIKSLIERSRSLGKRARVHLKVDTGMHRLGLSPRRLPDFLELLETVPEAELVAVMTHFATADDDDEFFRFQLESFTEVSQLVLRTGIQVDFHCANSAATLRHPESHFNLVRCGIAIYGLSPFQTDAAADGLRPALSLTSYLADIKQLAAGDTVGYGCSYRAPAPTTIGMVPIGYADGFNRLLSNRGQVLIGGRRYPLVGRVSMDQFTVDLGPQTELRPGAEVVLIGRQGDNAISAEEMAALLDTINYEITCGLSARVKRRYLEPLA